MSINLLIPKTYTAVVERQHVRSLLYGCSKTQSPRGGNSWLVTRSVPAVKVFFFFFEECLTLPSALLGDRDRSEYRVLSKSLIDNSRGPQTSARYLHSVRFVYKDEFWDVAIRSSGWQCGMGGGQLGWDEGVAFQQAGPEASFKQVISLQEAGNLQTSLENL